MIVLVPVILAVPHIQYKMSIVFQSLFPVQQHQQLSIKHNYLRITNTNELTIGRPSLLLLPTDSNPGSVDSSFL